MTFVTLHATSDPPVGHIDSPIGVFFGAIARFAVGCVVFVFSGNLLVLFLIKKSV